MLDVGLDDCYPEGYLPGMRFFSRLVLLVVLSLCAVAGQAQSLPSPKGDGRQVLRSVVADADRRKLTALFSDLSSAKTTLAAVPVERRIREIWLGAGGPTVRLLLDNAAKAAAAEDYATAFDCLDEAQVEAPDVAETYYRRAVLHYALGDISLAVGDIQTALRIEPRHFPALRALADMLADLGDDRRALEILRRLQAIDPEMDGLGAAIEDIVAGSHGRDL